MPVDGVMTGAYNRGMPSIDETNIPRYAMFRGRKVRIVHYDSTPGVLTPFFIIDSDDSKRSVRREDLKFIKEKKK